MLHEFLDKHVLHRRLSGGLKRLNKRVYTPTAVFDPVPEETTTEEPPTPSTTNPPLGFPLFPPKDTTTTSTEVTLPPPADTPTTTTETTQSSTTTSEPTPTSTEAPPPAPKTEETTTNLQPTPTPARATPTPEALTTEVHVTITQSRSDEVSGTSLASNPTGTPEPKEMSKGVVVGGIIAAVVAVAGIIFLIVYFVRKSRSANKDDGDEDDFNPDAWRRQSTMLPDDGPSGISRAMNYSRNGARPPTMIEQKLAGGAVSFNNVPPMPTHPYGYGGAYESFSPGQVVTPYTPNTTNSANPFFTAYGDSPVGSPVSVPAYDSAYDAQGNLVSRHQSVASSAAVSRHTSVASRGAPEPAADGQYVDMSRSSVTPFQAAQYAEISRHLNSTPPQALPLTSVTEEFEHPQEIEVPAPAQKPVQPLELQPSISFDEGARLTVQPTPREHSFPESPFADPSMIAAQSQHIPQRDSADSMTLQPPPPVMAAAKPRIPSIPPMLPEIHLQERSFSPVTMDFPIAPSSVRPSPSPFSTSFDLPSPPPNAHFGEPASPPPPAPPAQARAAVASKRPETVYDEEDAYAGI